MKNLLPLKEQIPINPVDLSSEEKAYLIKRGPITVAPNPAWQPFEYIDEKKNFYGIFRDLFGILITLSFY